MRRGINLKFYQANAFIMFFKCSQLQIVPTSQLAVPNYTTVCIKIILSKEKNCRMGMLLGFMV